jgi:hypothetical protein
MKRFTWIVKGFAPLAMLYSVYLILAGFGWAWFEVLRPGSFLMVMVGVVVLIPSIYAFLATRRMRKPDPDEAARKAAVLAIRERAALHKAAVHDIGS